MANAMTCYAVIAQDGIGTPVAPTTEDYTAPREQGGPVGAKAGHTHTIANLAKINRFFKRK